MEKKPRSSFLKLLSEPSFDFTPYFDKAVIEWLERNMHAFLDERPEASVFFIKEDEYRHMVAKHLPLTDDQQLTSYLREFDSGYSAEAAVQIIAPRLKEVGKIDLLLNAIPTLKGMNSNTVDLVINNLSDEAIRTLFAHIDLSRREGLRWSSGALCLFIKRLPSDLLIQVDPRNWTTYYDKDTAPNAVSALATKWPIEDVGSFLSKYGNVYPPLFCMHCGEKTLKSKPGYTLHRKTCDPNGLHPNIWTTIATRTV